jgi:hypothetical protein
MYCANKACAKLLWEWIFMQTPTPTGLTQNKFASNLEIALRVHSSKLSTRLQDPKSTVLPHVGHVANLIHCRIYTEQNCFPRNDLRPGLVSFLLQSMLHNTDECELLFCTV